MFRHAIAPARFFSQVPNEIIRHPRLSSDAVRLLTWQLSLPDDADEPLSRTAQRAHIKKCAFQRAKSELKQEGYLHEWRGQGPGGRWATSQLISGTPLTAEEAVAVRPAQGTTPGRPVRGAAPDASTPRSPAGRSPRGALSAAPSPVDISPTSAAPTAVPPAVGGPSGRAVGRQPRKDPQGNTSHPSPWAGGPATERGTVTGSEGGGGTGPGAEAHTAEVHAAGIRAAAHSAGADESGAAHDAEAFLLGLGRDCPHLVMSRRKARRWAPLAIPWLGLGLTGDEVRRALTEGLETARSPLGALRWRLEHAVPEVPPAGPVRPSRLSGMRECAGAHVQPRLFTPQGDESLCAACRGSAPGGQQPPGKRESEPGPGSGYRMFLAARRGAPAGTGAAAET